MSEMDNKEILIDFINCTEECLQFVKRVKNDEFDDAQLKYTFEFFKSKDVILNLKPLI